jgi:phospholipase C
MKFVAKSLLLLVPLTTIAYAQDPTGVQGKIKHVIVVIQENRSTDNLFGSDPKFEPGVNLPPLNASGLPTGNCLGTQIPLQATVLYSTYDIGHTYSNFQEMWDNGLMDGASNEYYPGSPMPCNLSKGTPLPLAYAKNDSTTSPQYEINP